MENIFLAKNVFLTQKNWVKKYFVQKNWMNTNFDQENFVLKFAPQKISSEQLDNEKVKYFGTKDLYPKLFGQNI